MINRKHTIGVYSDTHSKLVKTKDCLSKEKGHSVTFDDVINFLYENLKNGGINNGETKISQSN